MLDDYNLLLSRAFAEVSHCFAAVASPTLSKQETVSLLYERVLRYQRGLDRRRPLGQAIALRVELAVRVCVKFLAVLVGSIRFRVHSIPRGAVYIRTWLIPRSFAGGRIVDDYFRRLVDDLRTACPLIVAFQPLSLRDHFQGFRNASAPPCFLVPIGFLSVSDVCALFIEYVRSGRVQLSGKYELQGTAVTCVVNRSLDLDYFKLRSFQAYLERYIADKVARYEPKAFIYIFENQAWEKACLQVFRGTSTQCIGYQSSGFSDRFLNFFPSADDREQCEFPSLILTVGDLFADVLRTRGSYPVPIVTFGATRFEYPTSDGKYEVKAPRTEVFGRIIYAFAIHKYQYRRIIRDLVEAFDQSGVEVVLKFHPVFGKKYDRMPLPANFRVWEPCSVPLRDVYDVVLFNDNSFGFESLMQGVKAYEYICEAVYSEHRLYNFDLYDCVLDRTKLAALKDEILSGKLDKSYPVNRVSSYLNSAYRPYSPAASRALLGFIAGSSAAFPSVSGASVPQRRPPVGTHVP